MISLKSSTEILKKEEIYTSYLEEEIRAKNLKIEAQQKENQKLQEEIAYLKTKYEEVRIDRAVVLEEKSDVEACLDESQKRVDKLEQERSGQELVDAKEADLIWQRRKLWLCHLFNIDPRPFLYPIRIDANGHPVFPPVTFGPRK